jgi:glyoxylase-like metal-dependent hydrolase (beta-lactamase superfamily II)
MIHRFHLGSFRCSVVSDGQMQPPWEPPWDEFFGPDTGVPAEELAAALAEEGQRRRGVALGYNCLCVETEDGTVLIDTGLGKSFQGYGPELAPQVGRLGDALSAADIDERDISTVILTHLHQDHVRGAIWSGEPTFPNARHVVAAAEAAYWEGSEARAELADHASVARAALAIIAGRLERVEIDTQVLPGIRAIAATGHTPGHMAVMLSSAGERLLCMGDSFYDSIQLRRPAWWTRYDLEPRPSVATRQRLAAWAADEGFLVHAYHLPFPGLGRIERSGQAFAWRKSRGSRDSA